MDIIEREQKCMKGLKNLDKEKNKSRGSKLMNLIDCIWYVHNSCASLHIA
jgi:hypothetical protein